MAQFTNWENTKLIVEAHHHDLLHSAQSANWQKPDRRGFSRSIRTVGLLVIVFALLTLVSNTHAQSQFDAEPHLQRLSAALADGRFLDAYGEFFQINDSAPAVVIAVYDQVPETAADRQTQAFFLGLTGRAEQALQAVDALPDDAFTCTLRAIAHDLLGNSEESTAALAQAVAYADDDAQVYGLVANAAFINFNVEGMMTYSARALELDPDLPLALRAHSLATLFSGDPNSALEDANRGLELNPSFYGFHTLRANIYLALGQPEDALAELDAALALNPYSFVANGIRSGVNEALGNFDNAAQDFAASVNVKTVDIVEGETLEANVPTPLTMTLGRTFRLPFDGQANQIVTLHVTSDSPGAVDPTIMLLNPAGVPVAFNDDASDETLDALIEAYELRENGTYTVVVAHANGGSEGELTVLLEFDAASPSDQ